MTSPDGSPPGRWNVEWKTVLERGKIEPNENKSSFQDAQIDVHQLGVTKSLDGLRFGADHFARIELKYFKSGSETVGGREFYSTDHGKSVSLSYGFNLVHEPSYTSGIYFSVSPLIDFNTSKFSVPRIDLWNLGFRTSVELSDQLFVEGGLHLGSGIPGKQNPYLAFSNLFALRAAYWILRFGPYAEIDVGERTDAAYDAVYSPIGTQDRIRSVKVGFISGIEMPLSKDLVSSLAYVQKLGGYDAPATNALSFAIETNFE